MSMSVDDILYMIIHNYIQLRSNIQTYGLYDIINYKWF